MHTTTTKRPLLTGASCLAVVAIVATTVFVRALSTHAAASAPAPRHPYELGRHALEHAQPHFTSLAPRLKAGMRLPTGTCVAGLDSIPNFCGQFTAAGFGPDGTPNTTWTWNMVGRAPQTRGPGTTVFNAPIIPVVVQLLSADGSVAFTYDPRPFVEPVLQSPIFSYHRYTSSLVPTQYPDAIQRAELYHHAKPDWHTLLRPQVKVERTMQVPYGSYYYALTAEGTCCQFVLVDFTALVNLLFPPTYPFDASTVIGAAELAGDMTTQDITTLLVPNTFAYFNGNPQDCCWGGFHAFDFEPGVPSNGNRLRAYVVDYSSWLSPGNAEPGVEDVTALSHEMSEIFNDPFGTAYNQLDVVPWWSSGRTCQDNLEVGDVIDPLPAQKVVFPITMHGFTYHPENMALRQWFESNGTSDALDGAFSYPDESVLTTSNVSQNPSCSPPVG
jgi:hypothetical protein